MELFAGQYWGSDAAGLREVSRAHALADEARSLLKQRISSDLMLQTQRLAARGGLPKAPPGALGAFDAQNLRCSITADRKLLSEQSWQYMATVSFGDPYSER